MKINYQLYLDAPPRILVPSRWLLSHETRGFQASPLINIGRPPMDWGVKSCHTRPDWNGRETHLGVNQNELVRSS
eukprot:1622561-Ditylum_brightwellii.AAC.1